MFIPAYIPPHKLDQEFAHAADRYNMTVLATEPYTYFDVSDIELKRSGVSYTIDTMTELKKIYPEYELYFIIGADYLRDFQTWREPGIISKLCILLVACRDESGIEDLKAKIAEIK